MKKLFLILLTMFTLSGCGLHTVADDTRNDPISADQFDVDADDDPSEDATGSDTAADDTSGSTDEPKIYNVNDVVLYFNTHAKDYGIKVVYDAQEDCWVYETTETTLDLQEAVYFYLQFVPLYRVIDHGYMFKLKEKYDATANTYTYIAVTSNWAGAVTIQSELVDSVVKTIVLIYNGQDGIFE